MEVLNSLLTEGGEFAHQKMPGGMVRLGID